MTELDEQTAQIQKKIDGISRRFKPAVDDGADILIDTTDITYPEGQSPEDAMHHPYRLYGVATRHDVVYLLHPDITSNSSGAKQWWRMQYDTESSNPIIRRDRLCLQEVIERATSESASALLIYANDAATSVDPLPLSKELEEFVKKDKLAFLEELQKGATATAGATSGWENYYDGGYGNIARGGWDKESDPDGTIAGSAPPSYDDYEWGTMSAKQFHDSHRERSDETMSSTTLTPNTEVGDDDGRGVKQMVEVNGGMDAFSGLASSTASSVTVGGDDTAEAMDVDGASFMNVDMHIPEVRDDMDTQHIEVATPLEPVEKKGG
ncbi:hypothetical protein N0V83_007720 [Neocucurbitaria cava]|uniref:Uncharacterized protein n=1 Tax=Neocucurbitaria cava TaxID=798079 RepID=A0A9W9CJP9_9PLEO|nr:hypothetical protein N0V83_007720 [Neocucurbitaria cava]